MKKFFYFIWALVLVVTLLVTGFFVVQRIIPPAKTHYHAGFVVFEHNKKIDFSDNKYMNFKPCSLKQTEDTSAADIQLEKAHLHDNVGNLVHVEREGAVWKDLFTNIKYAIDYTHTTAYINGRQVSNWQDSKIKPYDSLVLFIGDNDPKHLKEGVAKAYMMEKEKKSDGCSS